jgi:hypothetical protein
MGAPKAKERGRQMSIYLTPARLRKLAEVAVTAPAAIYYLIDQWKPRGKKGGKG